ncbi:hypothetical protein N8T08_003818 [Aspergillus melleus]|uniref:Uncharacterized protein n=1 Tax=Aspergillus melleus TaxID=138277 RepID=A0ACC3B662_9EURO|nr:hypothetical protein N8T08_003818 [Aspergillus melleus]
MGDIASYMITSKDPLQYHELVPSTGEVVGSTSIDRVFCRFLSMRWGGWLNQESSHLVALGSLLMNWFEHLKHGYSEMPANYVYRHRLLGSDLPASVSHIELPRNELGEMIETIVRRICALLGRHLREAGKVVLVEGFSQSQYLRQQMATIFEREHHIAVFPLRDPQAAVATGAGLWGHGVSRPFARKTRSNYGVDEQTLDSSGVNRRVLWFIRKGRSYEDNETINRNVHLFQRESSVLVKVICIYESKETRPVSLIDAPGTYMIAQIPCDLSVLNLDSFPQVTVNGHKSTVVTCEIRATLGTQDGRIRFQALCQGEPIGDSQDSVEPASPTSDHMSISDD